MSYDLPFVPREPPRIADVHVHLDLYEDAEGEALLAELERHGIERVFASDLGPAPLKYEPPLEEVRRFNRVTARAVARHPNRVVGYSYSNPCHGAEALAEFRTGVEDLGLRGLKLWMSCLCDDPRVYPVVEQAIAYRAPILIHTWSKATGNGPTESEASHVARLAERYPEARIVVAHMSGNWPLTLRVLRPHPNVCVDTAGIDPEEGQIEAAVALLGPRRVVYGSDAPIRDVASQIAKVLGADVDAATRDLILWGNLDRLLSGG